MFYYLGKFLELNGIIALGLGLAWGLIRNDVRSEMAMLAAGAALFVAGYLLERKTARRD